MPMDEASVRVVVEAIKKACEAEFNELRSSIKQDAWDRGCNISLVDAIGWCRDTKELLQTMGEAAGVGSEKLRETWVPMLEIRISNGILSNVQLDPRSG